MTVSVSPGKEGFPLIAVLSPPEATLKNTESSDQRKRLPALAFKKETYMCLDETSPVVLSNES